MDFAWTAAQRASYDRILDLTGCWPAHEGGHFTREQWRRCGAAGLLGLPLPREYGGSGLGFLETAHAMEAFGRGYADTGLAFAAGAHTFACAVPVWEHGDDQLRSRLLPPLCSGERVGANAITEEDAGSDVYALRTRAVRDGDGYRITGTKSFVGNGPAADVFVVYAVTDPSFGHLGISAFAVERDTPGLRTGPAVDKTALASCPAGPLVLEDCYVPAGQLLGAEGQGAAVFQNSMRWERTCLFGAYLGVMERLLEHCVAHAGRRRQFGAPIGDNQAVSHRLADAKQRLEAARLLLWKACWKLDEGLPAAGDIALAKLMVSESVVRNALDAVQQFGAAGVPSDAVAQAVLRDALPSTVFSGTSEIQRETVAREIGL